MRKVLHGFAHTLCGAVRRRVVHDQNMQLVSRDGVRLREDPGKNSRNVLGLIESWEDDASDWFSHFINCGPESLLGATRSEEFSLMREGIHQ